MLMKILVVDDEASLEPLVRQIFRKKIRQKEFYFVFAQNGLEALDKLQADNEIDIVLTDIRMPKMDGLTLLAKLKELKPNLNPVLTAVIMSAFDDMENIRKAMNGGAFDFLTKPISHQDLRVTADKTAAHVQQLKKVLEQERLAQEALRRANEELEQRVEERTAELVEEIAERKRAEEALQLTQFSVDNAADAVFWIEQDGRLMYVNEAACRSLDYSRQELLTMAIHDIDPNYPVEVWSSHWKTTQRDSTTVESRHRTKDGRHFPVEVTFTYLEFGGQAYNFVFARDITWRHQATEALRESEARYRLIANRLQQELDLAWQIQQGLLPPSQPDWSGLDVVCYSQPAQEVGGDFYAYHAFEEGGFAIAVGDVSGKGMPAALLMAISLASLQGIVAQAFDPAELLTQLDQAIALYTNTTRQNCALCYIEIRPLAPSGPGKNKGSLMRVANAGCIPPLVRRIDGAVEWMEIGGVPLGAGLGTELGYPETDLTLSPGDLVILSSDGVVEATTPAGEMFSFDRLEQAVVSGPQTSAAAMLAHLRAEVDAFVDGAEAHDDLTMVVVQVAPGLTEK